METAGRIFGVGLVAIGVPLAGFAGVFIASFGAAGLVASVWNGDPCD